MNADNPNKKIPDETGEESDISPAERSLLDESLTNSLSVDNNNLRRSAIDLTDADGDPLNEASSNLAGEDLDVPGAELDDAQEEIGEEDEENNFYSNADTE
jgi:hypothetical protein